MGWWEKFGSPKLADSHGIAAPIRHVSALRAFGFVYACWRGAGCDYSVGHPEGSLAPSLKLKRWAVLKNPFGMDIKPSDSRFQTFGLLDHNVTGQKHRKGV